MASTFQERTGVWKNDKQLQQCTGLLREVWRPWLLRGHALSMVTTWEAQGQVAASCFAFEAKVVSTRVPRTQHHLSYWATCQVHIKPVHIEPEHLALFHTA